MASSVLSSLKNAREWAYPQLKSSAFLSRGVLTPEEFVKAGDELVYKCPTWSWEGGDPNKIRTYLPPDKQYLVTRNVPCQTRVSELENSVSLTREVAHIGDGDRDEEDEWMLSHVLSAEERQQRRDQELEDEFDILDEDGEVMVVEEKMSPAVPDVSGLSIGDGGGGEDDDDDDEYADMADFEDYNVMEDEAMVSDTAAAAAAATPAGATSVAAVDDNLVKTRTYDLSITYDKYYQTPRVWMMGYAATNTSQPLTGDEMLQDVMSDYANRTVTIENHPHVAGPHASIHPCQHGAVMKTIVRNLTKASSAEGDNEGGATVNAPSVEMYLFIFLKFVSSIIPTISYDFTMDVTASTAKK